MDCSVVICCYNSVQRISHTLDYLSKQQVNEAIKWEIVLVDNNSNDGTSLFASKLWLQLKKPVLLKIVHETKVGLSNARMRGVKEAKGEIIIFCDDDNWLTNNYISEVCSVMSRNNIIGALGGKSIAKTDSNFLPDWFDEYKIGYAIGEQHDNVGYLPKFKLLFGAGLAIRKKLINIAYRDFPALLQDRNGNKLSSGGDSEICLRLTLMNYKLYYDSSLLFYHYIPAYRLTEEYRDKLWKGLQLSSSLLNDYISIIAFVHKINGSKNSLLIKSTVKLILSMFITNTKWSKIEQMHKFIYLTGISLGNVDDDISKILKIARKLHKYSLY